MSVLTPMAGRHPWRAGVTVWAPEKERVDVVVRTGDGEARFPLTKGADGWFLLDDAVADQQLPAGTDYSFSVDGGPPFPDPRSQHQPAGVHGPSRVVDHGVFPWSDAAFRPPPLSSSCLIYELHVGTFSADGTFDGVIEHLDALREIGVTHVEIMPVAAFPGQHGWGYDGVAAAAPHDPYGGPEGLKRLVDACHGRDLAVLLDVVFNHLGPDGNYTGAYGPYFAAPLQTPWGSAANLDGAHSHEVRRFFCDVALGWMRDYHIDGLRLDAVHAFLDRSAYHFLEQLVDETAALGRELGKDLVLIAESDQSDPRLTAGRGGGGIGLNAQWNDDLHHCLHCLLTGEDKGYYEDFGAVSDLAECLRHGFVYRGRYSPHRQRPHGRAGAAPSPEALLGYTQTHDQVGNRARGERLIHLTSVAAAKAAAAVVYCSPFVPMLFQGEEWGASSPFQYFTDHVDEALAEAVSKGRRSEFGYFGWKPEDVPDPQAKATFAASKLDWSERSTGPHGELLDWYRRLAELRRDHPELRGEAPVDVTVDESSRSLRLRRGPFELLVAFGAGNARFVAAGQGDTLLTSGHQAVGSDILLTGPGAVITR